MSHAAIPTKKVGVYPLPAIGISSKKSSSEPTLVHFLPQFSAFFLRRDAITYFKSFFPPTLHPPSLTPS
ncbi:MAG: hypothetical protein SAL70_24170, partial [Scytonema sp. PMC 1070.18]|nr:hypothetical protein [Scytonema sp. PMC 1070.18]